MINNVDLETTGYLCNYLQIKPLTDEEKYEIYKKEKKDSLIKMLIQANKIIDMLYNHINDDQTRTI